MTDKKKNYINSFIKKIDFEEGGSILSVSINVDELNRLPKNKYGHVKLTIAKRQEPDKFGNTHYVYENDYKPGGGNTVVEDTEDTVNEDELF